MNDIVRVTSGTSLHSTGVLVEKIDGEIPLLYDALERILMPFITYNEWVNLVSKLPMYRKVKKGTCVFILTEKTFNEFNCLIANVNTDVEKTVSLQCLYTDDEAFNVFDLPIIETNLQFESIKKGLLHFARPDKLYVIKTTTTLISGCNSNHIENFCDFIFYIPKSCLLGDRYE